jgi:hypothetical protein
VLFLFLGLKESGLDLSKKESQVIRSQEEWRQFWRDVNREGGWLFKRMPPQIDFGKEVILFVNGDPIEGRYLNTVEILDLRREGGVFIVEYGLSKVKWWETLPDERNPGWAGYLLARVPAWPGPVKFIAHKSFTWNRKHWGNEDHLISPLPKSYPQMLNRKWHYKLRKWEWWWQSQMMRDTPQRRLLFSFVTLISVMVFFSLLSIFLLRMFLKRMAKDLITDCHVPPNITQ